MGFLRLLLDGLTACNKPRCLMCTAGKCLGNCGPNVHTSKSTDELEVALTIDDVPSRAIELFEELLDLLSRENVLVTFMVIGEHVRISERHEAAIVRAVREGHLLVNHMMRDEPATPYDREQFIDELDECQGLISRICEKAGVGKPGEDDRLLWFRPPHGVMNATMRDVLFQKGYSVAFTDVHSFDPAIDDADFHTRYTLRGTQPGSIICLHAPEEDNHRSQTLEVVPNVIEGLRDEGYEFLTLDQLLPKGEDSEDDLDEYELVVNG